MNVALCTFFGLLQNCRRRVLGGGNRRSMATSRPRSGEDVPRRESFRMLCGDHFRDDSILQQPVFCAQRHIHSLSRALGAATGDADVEKGAPAARPPGLRPSWSNGRSRRFPARGEPDRQAIRGIGRPSSRRG